MKLKNLVILAMLAPCFAQAQYWKIGAGISADGTVSSAALSILKPIEGTHHGQRLAFDSGDSVLRFFNPPMVATEMTVVINDNRPEIALVAPEKCVETVGAIQELIATTTMFWSGTLYVKAKFKLNSENCPSFAQKPYALLEYALDTETKDVEGLTLTTYRGPSFEGGRYELFR